MDQKEFDAKIAAMQDELDEAKRTMYRMSRFVCSTCVVRWDSIKDKEIWDKIRDIAYDEQF